VLECEPVAGLHGAADPEVEGQPQDVCAAVGRDAGGAVDGPVVDDDDVEAGIERADLVDDTADRLLLVQRRDDRGALELGELVYGASPSSFRAKPATPSLPLIRMRASV
jgi:hypothetical protein